MMKKIFGFLVLLFATQIQAQNCNDDSHSTNANDSWSSCQMTMNPNPQRGISHWIQYDLGTEYVLGTSHFWNYNVAGQTNRGMKNIVIDYSLDGVTWIEASTFQLSEATGNSNYTGEAGPDFGGIIARYLLITSLDNWGGGTCTGLSEVRFNIGDFTSAFAEVEEENTKLDFKLFPNPNNGVFTIEELDRGYDLIITDATGKVIQELNENDFSKNINISNQPNGLYFVIAKNRKTNQINFQKIIKQ